MTAASRGVVHGRVVELWRLTGRVGLHEAVLVVASFLLYFFIRGAVVDRAAEALANARDLIALERNLGFYWELEMQSWILGHEGLIRALNWVYFWGHMPLVIVLALWLYARHRHAYTLVRNAFLASGAIGIVFYALYPVAPPRLVPLAGFVDTMAIYDRVSYQAQETQAFVNPYAAMPSLHFGWSLLLAAAVGWVGRSRWLVVFAVAWPVAMFFAVVQTGNHFIIDAIAGAVVSFAGLGVAVGIERLRLSRGSREQGAGSSGAAAPGWGSAAFGGWEGRFAPGERRLTPAGRGRDGNPSMRRSGDPVASAVEGVVMDVGFDGGRDEVADGFARGDAVADEG